MVDNTDSYCSDSGTPLKALPPRERPMKPCFNIRGRCVIAREQSDHLLQRIEMQERRADAAKFLVEAKMGFWEDEEPYSVRKRRFDNQSFHFGPNV